MICLPAQTSFCSLQPLVQGADAANFFHVAVAGSVSASFDFTVQGQAEEVDGPAGPAVDCSNGGVSASVCPHPSTMTQTQNTVLSGTTVCL